MTFEAEVESGSRFRFGENWARFLKRLDEGRIREAERSLIEMLDRSDLSGVRILDIGSGSGLFSLAARRLNAEVVSFDFDPQSVACTAELRKTFFADDPKWTVQRGSVLDGEFVRSLGEFDIVYSWGVLHHTGQMWAALENAAIPVRPGGQLFISIYNDQGRASRKWKFIKRTYNRCPQALRFGILWPALVKFWWRRTLWDFFRGHPFETWRNYRTQRGMSAWDDVVDWVGGYPFEVAKPEEIFAFYRERGFEMTNLKTCAGGLGCNQFVFLRTRDDLLALG